MCAVLLAIPRVFEHIHTHTHRYTHSHRLYVFRYQYEQLVYGSGKRATFFSHFLCLAYYRLCYRLCVPFAHFGICCWLKRRFILDLTLLEVGTQSHTTNRFIIRFGAIFFFCLLFNEQNTLHIGVISRMNEQMFCPRDDKKGFVSVVVVYHVELPHSALMCCFHIFHRSESEACISF